MRFIVRALGLLTVPALLGACSDGGPTTPDANAQAAPSMEAEQATFPLYGLGTLSSAARADRCAADAHSEFDFWLGEWEVFDPEGNPVGTNSVTSELDGCVVSEHWVSAAGVPGRSINAFDAETGQWHQTWASANHSGHLRMAGGLNEDGQMVLSGQREGVNQGVTLFDEYTWTAISDQTVEQVGSLRVPAAGFEGTFVGIYERRDAITPAPEVATTGCQPGGAAEQARQLDFWIGDWTVSSANGKVIGSSTVGTDLSGCLIEERFSTPKGYEAVSFAVFDSWEQRWFRTYIDNQGERLELAGGVDGDGIAMTGPEDGPGDSGSLLQRVTLVPEGADAVRQTFEVSRDGGATWRSTAELLYQR